MFKISQVAFPEESLAKACSRQKFLLIPKGGGKDFHGIGLV